MPSPSALILRGVLSILVCLTTSACLLCSEPGSGFCGNGAIEGSEECDDHSLGRETCQSLGYYGGELSCGADCRFDLSGCEEAGRCGDLVLNGEEECDGSSLGGESCESLGYWGGELACTSACRLDTADCGPHGFCGDGELQDEEECEDENTEDWDGCTGCLISEFLVSDRGIHGCPDVQFAPSGDALVVWRRSYPDGPHEGSYGRRLGPDGERLGGEFRIEQTYNSWDIVGCPSLAVPGDGSLLVAWTYHGAYRCGVFLRRIGADGTPAGDAVRADDDATCIYLMDSARIAANQAGVAVVVWTDGDHWYPDSGAWTIYGRLFDPDGDPVGDELVIAAVEELDQAEPAVAMGEQGDFVVVWTQAVADDESAILARLYDPTGVPEGEAFAVHAETGGLRGNPGVAMRPGGGFVTVWEGDFYPDEPAGKQRAHGVFGRLFGSDGSPAGAEVRADPDSGAPLFSPDASVGPDGRFLVGWMEEIWIDDQRTAKALVRLFGPDGTPVAEPLRADLLVYRKTRLSVATDSSGNHAVVWGTCYQGVCAMGSDLFGQRISASGEKRGTQPW